MNVAAWDAIRGGRLKLRARVATLDELGLDALEWRAAAVEELELLRDIARALADEAIGGRQARKHAATRAVGECVARASMHLDARTPDLRAVEGHLRNALEHLEAAR